MGFCLHIYDNNDILSTFVCCTEQTFLTSITNWKHFYHVHNYFSKDDTIEIKVLVFNPFPQRCLSLTLFLSRYITLGRYIMLWLFVRISQFIFHEFHNLLFILFDLSFHYIIRFGVCISFCPFDLCFYFCLPFSLTIAISWRPLSVIIVLNIFCYFFLWHYWTN